MLAKNVQLKREIEKDAIQKLLVPKTPEATNEEESKIPVNKRTQDFAFVFSDVKNKRAMDKQSMTKAMLGLGGADGIDLDKN